MRKNSIKNTRVSAEVQRILAEVIRSEIKDPRVDPFTSVVECQVAPDLKTCKVFISVLGEEESKQNTLKGLKNAEGFLRSCLAERLNLRITPELRFVLDRSMEYGANMMKLINEVTGGMNEDNADDEQNN